jgi:hypothetical protein
MKEERIARFLVVRLVMAELTDADDADMKNGDGR